MLLLMRLCFEGFVREGKEEAARDERAVIEAFKSKRGQVFRTIINLLFDK